MSSLGFTNSSNWRIGATEVGALSAKVSTETYTANVAALQQALDGGGDVAIRIPGTYQFNGVMYIPSFTTLYKGAGVILKVAAGSPSALFTNSHARDSAVVVNAGNASYGTAPDGNNYCAIISNMTPAQLALFPVDSFVSVVSLGHGALGAAGTAAATRGYRGVWKVLANDGVSQLKYEIENVYPGSGPSTNALQLFPANQSIAIVGPGTLDGNGTLASQSFKDGDPRGNVVWWRHAIDVTVDGGAWQRGATWTIGSNNVRNYQVRNCAPALRLGTVGTAVDFIHLSGYHRTVVLEKNAGDSPDNFVGLTIDCTEGTGADFPYQAPGDMYCVKILNNTGHCISALGAFGVIGIYGPAAYKYHDICIDGLGGLGSSGVQLANYPATNQFKLCITKLEIKNVYAQVAGASVEFTASSVYDIGEMLVEDTSTLREDVPAFRINDTATGTIRSLVINRLATAPYDATTYTRTVPLARLGGINISALSINGSDTIALAANIKAFAADGPGNIPKIGISNSSATGTGTAHLWGDTGAGTAAAPVYYNSTYNAVPL